jgi:polyisoprenoid-binding protein YceI
LVVAGTVTFRLVPEESRVRIHANSNVHPIDGEATGIEGQVEVAVDGSGEVDLASPVKATVQLAVASLQSGNPAYDTEMRRRLEERRYPTISGQLTTAARADGDDTYRVSGNLTFHGATRTVTTPMTVSIADDQLVARWEQTIDIRDFNLKAPRILMFKVDPEVRVEVELIGRRAESE